MTVSEISEKILDGTFDLDVSHSEGDPSTPSDIFIDQTESLDHQNGESVEKSDISNGDDAEPIDNGVIDSRFTVYQDTIPDISDDSLTHHGILGMKWGVRRTPEQLGHKTRKRRYKDRQYEDETPQQHAARLQRESNERIAKTQAKEHAASEKRQLRAEADKQKRLIRSQEKQQKRQIQSQEQQRREQLEAQERQRKEQQKALDKKTKSNLDKGNKRQDPKTMTDQEIRDAIARMQLEKQYKDMSRGVKGKAVKEASDIFGGAGKKIATGLLVTYGTKLAVTMIDNAIDKKKKGKEA